MYGTDDKTVAITNDMITYMGSTENEGSIEVWITYKSELYGGYSFSFTIFVMPETY